MLDAKQSQELLMTVDTILKDFMISVGEQLIKISNNTNYIFQTVYSSISIKKYFFQQ